jgi:transposase
MKKQSKHTIGIDLGDRQHEVCVIDHEGEIAETRSIGSDRDALRSLAKKYPQVRVIIECGAQSPWISRFLTELGMEVVVANARKVRAIWDQDFKSDQRDAEMLARIGRLDVKLLRPVRHGSEDAQKAMLSMKLRDTLVRRRRDMINAIRGTLKSLGYRVGNPDSARFHKIVLEEVPADQHQVIEPVVKVLAVVTAEIKGYDKLIAEAAERHPVAKRLQQIVGIGPVTALYFVLKIEDPDRFGRVRDIGAYLGLCPKRDQSGDCDKQLRITKAGDSYLRRLLVSAAQYILGHFGKECALREVGLKLSERGGPRAKKKAVVAVARKLAVLMMSLWKSGADYDPRLGCGELAANH